MENTYTVKIKDDRPGFFIYENDVLISIVLDEALIKEVIYQRENNDNSGQTIRRSLY